MLALPDNTLLLGTTSNSMLQLPLNQEGPVFEGVEIGPDSLVTQGHFDRLTALSLLPAGPAWFMTAGYDSQLCVFDAATHRGIQKTSLNRRPVTAAFWHPKDGRIVMALWDHKELAANCLILNQTGVDLHELYHQPLGRSKIRCITTHDESKSVLFGSIDGMLIVVQEEEVEEEEMPRWTQRETRLFQEPIATLDVSRHNDPKECLIRATTETGKHKLVSLDAFVPKDPDRPTKDIDWASYTALIHGPVIGVWRSAVLQRDVVTSAAINDQKKLVAIGTKSGVIYLFRYPCLQPKAFCHKTTTFRPVIQLRFTADGKYLVGIGGEDATILQWCLI